MSVNQSKLNQIRYLKRQNLEEEAKIVGNYYRDIIVNYGIDCNYYKLKLPYMEVFSKIIDQNNLILHAYGEDVSPDYSISSDMITYMEVEQDIMNLNKYGVIPDMNVNFYFDSKDFACSLAYKLGQLKEYPIREQEFIVEVPELISDFVELEYEGEKTVEYLSSYQFPYKIGYGVPEFYQSDILSGKFCVDIGPYDLSTEYTVMCRPYEHGDVDVSFPVNDSIYKSFNHTIGTKEYVDQMLFLKYSVVKVQVFDETKYILKGKLYGTVLFHDINRVGKYLDMIHPEVGDIVTIDFPDENNRQQFEITDCNDKNLGNDGINPLLHRYVWKCQARRYINSGEDFPERNESNERMDEKTEILDKSTEDVAKKISVYDDDNSDGVYGGYEREDDVYDKGAVDRSDYRRLEYIDDGNYIQIFRFNDGSMLVTDGYELYYVDSKKYMYQITTTEDVDTVKSNLVNSGLQYIKSSDDALFFINFDGKIQKICEDEKVTRGEIQTCLNSLVDATYDRGNNNENDQFYYKFRESNTVLMSVDDCLYCRFGNKEHRMVKLNFERN